MGVYKVQLANGETLVDMSDATATSETVLAGYTAYGADGNLILGTAASTKRTEVNITLPVSGWVDNEQTVAVPAAVSGCTVFVGGDMGSEPEYSGCGVYCSGQGNGTLTFSCSAVPSKDVVADATILS